MNSYTLSRQWFAFAFENQKKVKPVHGSLYFWLIELANRMGWPEEFGNPGSQCMAACGIGSYNTYKKTFDDLQEWGFIKVVRKSINQHQATIIALSKIDEAPYKALDRAIISPIKNCKSTIQSSVQSTSESTVQSTDSIIKPLTNKPINLEPLKEGTPLLKDETSEGLKTEKEKPKEKSCAKKEKVGRATWKHLLEMPFPSETFAAKWEEYCSYRETRKPVKIPFGSMQIEQRLLNKLSAFNEQFSISQLDRAMEGNWQGLVFSETMTDYKRFLDRQNNGQPNNTFRQNQPSGNKPSGAELAYLIAS